MPARLAELPNVPTMAEQGFPGIGTNAWQGLFAPAATPKPIVDKLYAAVAAVLSRPEMKEMLARQLMTVTLSGSPQRDLGAVHLGGRLAGPAAQRGA